MPCRRAAVALVMLMLVTGGMSLGAAASNCQQENTALAKAVTDELTQGWLEPNGALVVIVDDGVVELLGTVPSAEMIDEAVQIAANVEGVRRVINRLNVRPPELSLEPDAQQPLQPAPMQEEVLQEDQAREETMQEDMLREERR